MPSLRFLALRLLLVTVMLLGWSSVHAQITNVDNTTSTPIAGAGHDYIHLLSETVNPSNGSVSLRIALPMPKGREMSLPFSIGYDSNSLHHLVPGFYPNYGTVSWQSNKSSLGQGGWSYSLPAAGLVSTDVTEGNYPNYYTCTLFSNYLFHDASGASHALGLASYLSPNGPCIETPIASGGDGQVYASLGNNGWQWGYLSVFSADGTLYQFNQAASSNDDSALSFPDYIEDRNGNKITHSANSFVDTLGRNVLSWDTLLGSSTTPTNLTAGGMQYQVTWKTTTANFSTPYTWVGNNLGPNSTAGTCSSAVPAVSDTQTVVSQIALPNGKEFTFYYGTDNPDPTFQNPYGLLSEIDYPDGGWVKYTWKLSDTMNEIADYPGLISATCTGTSMYCPKPAQDWCLYQYRTPVVASRLVGFGGSSNPALTQTFTYSTAWGSTPSGNAGPQTWVTKSSNVTTTDNVIGKSALVASTYTPVTPPSPPYSHTTLISQLPVESTIQYYDWGNTVTPLRTVTKSWYNQLTIASEQTTLETGQSSKTVYCYAGSSCDPRFNAPPFPQVIKKDEYDFGAASPTRTTLTTYQGFSGTPGVLGEIPCKVQIQNSAGTTIGETDYYYDGSTSLCAAISSGVAVGGTGGFSNHDENAFGTGATTPRGNATKVVKKCLQGCSDATTTYTFDEAGNILSAKDPCGNTSCSDMTGTTSHITTYSYADKFDSNPSPSTNAYLTKITDPLGHISNFKYAYSDGQLIQSWDQNDPNATGLGTRYFYADPLRRLTETDYLDGGKTNLYYTDTAPSPSVTTVRLVATSPSTLNISTTSVMDGMGHVTQSQLTSDPDGATYTDTTYDGFGRVRTQSNSHRSTPASTDGTTTNYYDALGRACLIVPPDGTLPSGNGCPASQPNNTIFTTFSGNTTTVTDQAGKSRKSVSDGLGRLTTVYEDPSNLNYETDYTYDRLDNLLTVIQKGGSANSALWRTRTFTYNSLSELTQAANPESGAVNYSYDANGNLSTKSSPKPNQTGSATVVTSYVYDFLNRLTQKSFNDGSTPTIKYGYDGVALTGCATAPPALTDSNPVGTRTSMCDGAGAESWSHDSMGRVLFDSRTTNSLTATYPYTYNLDGSIKTIAYGAPGSTIETITYTQGGAGRLVSETSVFNGGNYTYVSAAHYAPNGALCGLSYYGWGAAQNVSFNNRFQPQHWHVTSTPWGGNPAPPPCQPPSWASSWIDLVYNYVDAGGHNNGNVAKITNNVSHAWSQNFTYDSLNRIATAQTDGTMASGGSGNCWAETYTIDAWGNLQSNASNPTTQSAYTGCIQEAPANLTGIVQPSNRLSGMGFTTDAAGNLIADGVHTFTFDAENHLLSTAQSGQTTVTYQYDGDGKRVQKSSGTLYWYGLNSEPLVETSLTGATNFAYYYFNGRITNRRPWYHVFNLDTYVPDALGSTRIVSGLNASGAGAWDDSDYYPYGGEFAHGYMCCLGNHYKFTGKERDTESNLDNFEARYYASNLGRFTSPDDSDPSGTINPQGLNLYSYVQNNPSNATDPDGHDCVFRLGGNEMYYQKGDCSAAPSNADGVTYVPGDIDPKSAVYHEDTGTLNVNYTPYGDQRGAIANIFVGTPSHTAPTEFEKFASRIAVGADNVNAFALQAGLQAGAAALGGVAQLGLEALAARNASPAVRVVINWAHRIQDIRPGHIPPPGTQEEIQAAVEAAVKAKRYTTDANGVINGTTIIRGIEVGFRGKQIGLVVRVSSVFGIR